MGKAAWCILGAVALMEVVLRLLGWRSDSLEARVKEGATAHISCRRGPLMTVTLTRTPLVPQLRHLLPVGAGDGGLAGSFP